MIIKKLGLSLSLALIIGLQGCGGGDSTKVDTSNTSNLVVNGIEKPLNTLSSETNSMKKTIYLLKSKLEIFPEYNATTVYTYDSEATGRFKMVTTDGVTTDKSYTYDNANKVLEVKVKNLLGEMELTQRATFEDGVSKKSVNLARNDNQIYLTNTFDFVTYPHNVRIIENMTDIDMGLFNVKRYAYTGDYMTTLTSGYRDSIASDFVEEKAHTYSYDDGLKIDGVAVNLNHTFTYSDDNKTVTEMADGVMVRRYFFEDKGE